MKGFELYKMHNALNLHFNKKVPYDYFQYHGKTRVNEDSFKKCPQKWQYAGIEAKIEHLLWFMYNAYKEQDFSYLPPKALFFKARSWVKNQEYQHPDDYLTNIVSDDIVWLSEQYGETTRIFETEGLYPNIYTDYKKQNITLETFLLVDNHIKTVCNVATSADTVSWPIVVDQLNSLKPFAEQLFDRATFEHLFAKLYLSSTDK